MKRTKSKITRKITVVAATVTALCAMATPARAATQTIDATISSSYSMDTAPSASVGNWTLAATGANSTSGGSVVVTSNQPYSVTVTADKSKMTEYETATSAYVSTSPKTLAEPLTVTATSTGGTGVAAAAVVGVSSTLATGTGLGTDSYSLSLSQPTTIADPALPAGKTYHIVLTYTLASTL